jgi:two-component system sensor histidine kinase AgrC
MHEKGELLQKRVGGWVLGPLILPWYIVLLVSIPETIFIIKLGFQLFNVDVDYKKAFVMSFLTAILTILIRKLPLVFGFHTLILIFVLVVLTRVIMKIRLWHGFISVLVGVLILGVLESTLLPIFQKITSTNTESLILQPWLNVGFAIPLVSVMGILYLLTKKFRVVIFDLSLNED